MRFIRAYRKIESYAGEVFIAIAVVVVLAVTYKYFNSADFIAGIRLYNQAKSQGYEGYVEKVTSEHIILEENGEWYVLKNELMITDYIGEYQINDYVNENYSLQKCFPLLEGAPDTDVVFTAEYDIYDSRKKAGMTHDYTTGWKSKYYIVPTCRIKKDYAENNDIDLTEVINVEVSAHGYEEYLSELKDECVLGTLAFGLLYIPVVSAFVWFVIGIFLLFIDKIINKIIKPIENRYNKDPLNRKMK